MGAWKSNAAQFRLLRRFLAVFGGIWLLLEPAALWKPKNLEWGWAGYLILAASSFAIAAAWAWPRRSITKRVALSDTKITIQVSDLLEQKGNLIIGATDVFDTELGEVISPSSVQGQFQQRFFPNVADLDSVLEGELAQVSGRIDANKTDGKNVRYPIGTVAVVDKEGNRFYLVAYSRMEANLKAKSDICKLTSSLEQAWDAIRVRGQRRPVHMAVVGSDLSRTGLSRSLLIQLVILSFLDEERQENLTSHLYIHVHENDYDDIDFVFLEDWLSGLTRSA